MFGFFEPDVPEVDAREVYASIKNHEEMCIVDVRTPAEHAKESIEGSIHIPIEVIDREITSKVVDKSQKIIMYCLSGARSKVAVEKAISLGYTNVFSMKSGLLAWRVYKLPTISAT